MPINRGSTPATALATIRATGLRLNLLIASSDAMRSATAPSLRPDELPAVTEPLPSSRNAGFSFDNTSSVVSGLMNSS